MLYITGDTHGEVSRFIRIAREYALTAEDTLVVAGDFGCIFYQDERDAFALDQLAAMPFTILFVDGNHECFPRINAYPQEEWHGGKVHRIRPNVLHLMRGQIFDLEGTRVFVMGGGYSIDKGYRREGLSWWPQEMPSVREYEEAWHNLTAHGNKVDVIVSHAAPDETMQAFVEQGIFKHRFPQEAPLNMFLENVRQIVKHRLYYFGHLHMDRELFRNQIALYYEVYRLAEGVKADPVD